MTLFLISVAEKVINSGNYRPEELAIILPNRRAGMFLKRHLAARFAQPVWAPAVFSIEDFMATLSGLTYAEPIRLIVTLYRIHCRLFPDNPQAFDEFAGWAQVMLNDFNEIDQYLVDAEGLYAFLSEEKALNLWHPGQGQLTDFEQQYLTFFRSVIHYYQALRTELITEGKAYRGMAARHLLEDLPSLKTKIPWNRIIFAGFNALTATEEKLIRWMLEEKIGEIYWDTDTYYIDDQHQEAGRFLRRYFNGWPKVKKEWTGNYYKDIPKAIDIIGVPGSIGQVKFAGQVVKQWKEKGIRPDQIAVVLNDESLLLPLLHSLPEELGEFNITMGFPLEKTSLFNLLDSMFQVHEKMSTAQRPDRYYTKDVLAVLNHPFFQMSTEENLPPVLRSLAAVRQHILSMNRAFLSLDDLHSIPKDLFTADFSLIDHLFIPWKDLAGGMKQIAAVLEILKETLMSETADSPEIQSQALRWEYLFHFTLVVNQLNDLLPSIDPPPSLPSIRRLFRQLVTTVVLPFSGEPLKGFQVMGMLETRCLDFSHLILLSVNEDILPPGKHTSSLIPYDIRRAHELPTYHDRNAVAAYHFYRLIQRAEKVVLLYSTETDGLRKGEKSRFIRQIQLEMPAWNPKTIIREKILRTPMELKLQQQLIIIEKDEAVLQKLGDMAKKGFSASTLSTYIACPLMFCFSHIMKLEETEEPDDTIDAKDFGSVVHEALKNLFQEIKGKILTKERLDTMHAKVSKVTSEAFQSKYKIADIDYGENYLMVRVAESLIHSLIRAEIERVGQMAASNQTIRIDAIEQICRKAISDADGTIKFNLVGFIDRIETVSETTTIVDYKTGKVDDKKLEVEDISLLETDPEYRQAFQLLMYGLLCRDLVPEDTVLNAGLYSLKHPGAGIYRITIADNGTTIADMDRDILSTFEKIVISLVRQIMDPAISFDQTEDEARCVYCPYKDICGR
ncbi:MAG: hypothetical protein FJY10_04570 [Bacteroidetes bacterium]|nr:hypothetical protein [Bacteroidota bacterium]